jgi:hypothetical protein
MDLATLIKPMLLRETCGWVHDVEEFSTWKTGRWREAAAHHHRRALVEETVRFRGPKPHERIMA